MSIPLCMARELQTSSFPLFYFVASAVFFVTHFQLCQTRTSWECYASMEDVKFIDYQNGTLPCFAFIHSTKDTFEVYILSLMLRMIAVDSNIYWCHRKMAVALASLFDWLIWPKKSHISQSKWPVKILFLSWILMHIF